jgi:hypothetical protein
MIPHDTANLRRLSRSHQQQPACKAVHLAMDDDAAWLWVQDFFTDLTAINRQN